MMVSKDYFPEYDEATEFEKPTLKTLFKYRYAEGYKIHQNLIVLKIIWNYQILKPLNPLITAPLLTFPGIRRLDRGSPAL